MTIITSQNITIFMVNFPPLMHNNMLLYFILFVYHSVCFLDAILVLLLLDEDG